MNELISLGVLKSCHVKAEGGRFRGWMNEECQRKFLIGRYLWAVLRNKEAEGSLPRGVFDVWKKRISAGVRALEIRLKDSLKVPVSRLMFGPDYPEHTCHWMEAVRQPKTKKSG